MENSQNAIAWWWAHRPVLGGLVLFLAALLTNAFPLFAQHRLPKVSLPELIRQFPHLRWLRWGRSLVFWGGYLLAGLGFGLLQLFDNTEMRRLNDAQGLFVGATLLCLPPVSAGVLALKTGIYKEIVGRGEPAGKYYCVANTRLSWVPLAQSITALAVAALSVIGFLLATPR